jgi:hypothetical protein
VDRDTKQEELDPCQSDPPEMDPADSDLLRDELKGQTIEHAVPPRLEDEGQPGG